MKGFITDSSYDLGGSKGEIAFCIFHLSLPQNS